MKDNRKYSITISSYDDQKNPVYSGGGAHSVHQLAKRLTKKYKVTVLTGTYKNARDEIIDNINYVRIGSDIFGHKIGQIIYQFALFRHARNGNYDIWIESTTPPFTFSLLPLFAHKPVLSWIHMICSYDMQRKYKINFRVFEQELSRYYKYFIAPTDWVKNEIKTMNKHAKIFTITQGFEQEPVRENLNLKSKFGDYILFIGRIEVDQKGLDLLIQALKLSGSSMKLVIAGTGSGKEEKNLDELIKKYRIGNKIIRVGRIQGERKEALFNNSKAVVIPSRFETFSITALEAFMHQKQVICFDIPQLRWIPKNLARKVRPFNINKLAEEIKLVQSGYPVMKANKKFLSQFSWDNTTKSFEKCISQISRLNYGG